MRHAIATAGEEGLPKAKGRDGARAASASAVLAAGGGGGAGGKLHAFATPQPRATLVVTRAWSRAGRPLHTPRCSVSLGAGARPLVPYASPPRGGGAGACCGAGTVGAMHASTTATVTAVATPPDPDAKTMFPRTAQVGAMLFDDNDDDDDDVVEEGCTRCARELERTWRVNAPPINLKRHHNPAPKRCMSLARRRIEPSREFGRRHLLWGGVSVRSRALAWRAARCSTPSRSSRSMPPSPPDCGGVISD